MPHPGKHEEDGRVSHDVDSRRFMVVRSINTYNDYVQYDIGSEDETVPLISVELLLWNTEATTRLKNCDSPKNSLTSLLFHFLVRRVSFLFSPFLF